MIVLVLSPYNKERLRPILQAIEGTGDDFIVSNGTALDVGNPDIIIFYGYRHIIKRPEVEKYWGKLFNLHIAYLPWNRGAHPNLWSWYDDTPKGASIHYVDSGIDTGPIIARRELKFVEGYKGTLRETYDSLQGLIRLLFSEAWPMIRKGWPHPFIKDSSSGSYHTTLQSLELIRHFPQGLDTPVHEIVEFGREQRASRISREYRDLRARP